MQERNKKRADEMEENKKYVAMVLERDRKDQQDMANKQ